MCAKRSPLSKTNHKNFHRDMCILSIGVPGGVLGGQSTSGTAKLVKIRAVCEISGQLNMSFGVK